MSEQNNSHYFLEKAKSDFETAYQHGFWHSIWSWFSRKDNSLFPFDEVRKNLPSHTEHYAGLRQIDVDKIVGSVGRYNDFDRSFLPRQTRTRSRWISVDQAHLLDISLPAIEVYKVGEVYFVKDGNHRVSVARERGQKYIDASIIEIDLPVEITPDINNIDEMIRQLEKADFWNRTHINLLRPEAAIDLTLPGGYGKLLEHIEVHGYFMGLNQQAEIPWDVAIQSWYDQVYLPLIQVIRDSGMLKNFPGRSEADLYLWIIEHLWYLREEYNEEISLEEAAEHFVENYSNSLLHRIGRMFKYIANMS
jgi:hypothetical protein